MTLFRLDVLLPFLDMARGKKKRAPEGLTEPGSPAPGPKQTSDVGNAQKSAMQLCAPQKDTTANNHSKADASPSAPPLAKVSRKCSPPAASRRPLRDYENYEGEFGYSEDDYECSDEDKPQFVRELEYRPDITRAVDAMLDEKQKNEDLKQQLLVSEKRAEDNAKALKASEDAQKTQATNFAKDKQNMQKQFDEVLKRLSQLEKKEKKGDISSQATTSKARPEASPMETDFEKFPGPPPLPPPPQPKVPNSSEAGPSRPQQSKADAPWAKDLQKSLKIIEKRLDQLQAAVNKGSPGSSSSYAAVTRQGKGPLKGNGAAPCPPPTQIKPPSPDPVASPLAQQTFVLAGVQSLQCAKDNVNLETLRKGAEMWLAGLVGEPVHVRSARFLGLKSNGTTPRKILLIVDSPDEAQLIRQKRCLLRGKSECVLDGLTSSVSVEPQGL